MRSLVDDGAPGDGGVGRADEAEDVARLADQLLRRPKQSLIPAPDHWLLREHPKTMSQKEIGCF